MWYNWCRNHSLFSSTGVNIFNEDAYTLDEKVLECVHRDLLHDDSIDLPVSFVSFPVAWPSSEAFTYLLGQGVPRSQIEKQPGHYALFLHNKAKNDWSNRGGARSEFNVPPSI